MPVNNQCITEKNHRGNQIIFRDKWKWKHDGPKPMGCSKRSYNRKDYSDTSFLKKTGKISNNLAFHLKELEKEEQTKHKVSRRKETLKIKAEINEIEINKTIEKIKKTKTGSLKR